MKPAVGKFSTGVDTGSLEEEGPLRRLANSKAHNRPIDEHFTDRPELRYLLTGQ